MLVVNVFGLHNPKDEGSMVLRKVNNYSPVNMERHPRRLESSCKICKEIIPSSARVLSSHCSCLCLSKSSPGPSSVRLHHHHKHKGLDPLIRSVSKVTAALSNVSSVFQLLSFFVVCSSMISKGFGFVAFFASVETSTVCIHLSCLVCL